MSFDPNQLRGKPSNKGSWVANDNGDPESPLVPSGAAANPESLRLPSGPYRPGTPGGYETRDMAIQETGRSLAFSAKIFRDSTHVLTLVNDGRGGRSRLQAMDPSAHPYLGAEYMAFEATGKAVYDSEYEDPDQFFELLESAKKIQQEAKARRRTTAQTVHAVSVGSMPHLTPVELSALSDPERFSDRA